MFSNLGAFQAIIAKGAPRRASAGGDHKKGQTLVVSECKDPVLAMAFDKMKGQCMPLAYSDVTLESIASQVHQ